MAGDGAAHGEVVSAPLQPCSWAATAAGEGQMLKADGSSSSAVPNGEDGRCSTTRRKVAVVSQAKKPSDSMAVDDDDDDDDWVYIGRDENSNLVVGDLVIDKKDPELLEHHHPAGLDENGDLTMDKELPELLEISLDMANPLHIAYILNNDTFWSDNDTFWSEVVYSNNDESEEVCSGAQHQFEMMSIK